MKLKDRVYGEFKITEPVIIDLINSKPAQRLKNIEQLGLPKEWHYGLSFSRFEHTMGVLALCYKFNRSVKEKIAAILHDIAHTAFSHVYDYLLDYYHENFHDEYLKDYIENTEIRKILKKHNFDSKHFHDIEIDSSFDLIKQKTRRLTFDRLDYTLREYTLINKDYDYKSFLDSIIIKDNKIILENKDKAKEIYDIYKYLYENNWGSDNHKTQYMIFVDILNYAIKKKLITHKDFYKDDKYILDILLNSKDDYILNNIKSLETKDFEIKTYKKKLRVLNPLYLENNQQKEFK